MGSNIFKTLSQNSKYLEFSYKSQDSLFDAAGGDPQFFDSTLHASEKKIASNGELLDFSKEKKSKEKAETAPSNKIIHLNSASVSGLMTLPGVGKKTAQNILEYKKKNGRFNKVNDLLSVRGIGKSKFEKIKKLVTID